MNSAERYAKQRTMQEAILTYYDKLSDKPDYLQYEDYSNVDDEIKKKFRRGTAPVPRTTQTDLTPFKERFGYELPYEIQDYINLFWHSYICGFIDDKNYTEEYSDGIVLFEVIKYKNEKDDDVICHEHGLMDLSEKWGKNYDGKFIPVGWTGYCAADILYEVKTGKIFCANFEGDGVFQIADSLAQLISKLEP